MKEIVTPNTNKEWVCKWRSPTGQLLCLKKLYLLPYFYFGQFTKSKDPKYLSEANPDYDHGNVESFCPECWELHSNFGDSMSKLKLDLEDFKDANLCSSHPIRAQ